MRYMVEKPFDEFEFWGGAVEVYNQVCDNERIETIVQCELESICENQIMTATDVNDWMWFECESWLEGEGYISIDDDGSWIVDDED